MVSLPTYTVDDVIDQLRAVLAYFVPGDIIRAQVNMVSMPEAPCAVLTELNQQDLCVPYQTYSPTTDELKIDGSAKIDVQIDFYGPAAGDYCKATKNALRSMWGFDQFSTGIKPLYTSDGIQSPLITGEQQYESRWTLTVSMQYNPAVSLPQQFADIATVAGIYQADI